MSHTDMPLQLALLVEPLHARWAAVFGAGGVLAVVTLGGGAPLSRRLPPPLLPACLLQMAAAIKPKQGVEEPVEQAPIHRIRITLTSRNVKNLEKGERAGGRWAGLADL